MAIKHVSSANREMTVEGFKEWLKKFDADKDGRISIEELREAVRSRVRRFASWKSKRAFHHADTNHNGFIDDAEMVYLVPFAQKKLGLKIYTD